MSISTKKLVGALIFAGGVGKRMGPNFPPKQFLEIADKPILVHTLEKFQANDYVEFIVVVCVSSHLAYCRQLIKKWGLSKCISIVPGGQTGQESIRKGLLEIAKRKANENPLILLHDGVRPFVTDELITKNINTAIEKRNCVSVSSSIETVGLLSRTNGELQGVLERGQCVNIKAPQTFFLNDLLCAHHRAISENYSAIDSASLMSHFGWKLNYVHCLPNNIKITNYEDYILAKALAEIIKIRKKTKHLETPF